MKDLSTSILSSSLFPWSKMVLFSEVSDGVVLSVLLKEHVLIFLHQIKLLIKFLASQTSIQRWRSIITSYWCWNNVKCFLSAWQIWKNSFFVLLSFKRENVFLCLWTPNWYVWQKSFLRLCFLFWKVLKGTS